ncbi:hypothetical protein AAFC00_005722 [Neodothiora populina]|uniref:Chloride channel protein n=1 Tax=Neodothiora populina TaxID=2781224 RepID=A0ABR3P5Y8_9PEZI
MSNLTRGHAGQEDSAQASSSRDPYHDIDFDSDGSHSSDLDIGDDLLAADPLHDGDLGQKSSFGRSLKAPLATVSRYLTPSPSHSRSQSHSRSRSRSSGTSPANNGRNATIQQRRPNASSQAQHLHIPQTTSIADFDDPKGSATSHDWYPENHSRLTVPYDDLTAIDWIQEYAKERSRLRHLHASTSNPSATTQARFVASLRQLADDSHAWIILVATGIAVGAIAAFIDVSVDWLADLKTGVCRNHGDGGAFYLNKVFCCWGYDDAELCPDWSSWSTLMGVRSAGGSWMIDSIFYFVFSVLFASAAAVLVARFSPYAKQSGIPEIKTVLGGFVIRRFLGVWTLVTKSLGLCLAVASGLVLGKEGPLVHVACCCANLFMKPFTAINTNEARKREVLSAAAASGISVAFGAPVGGVLFSLEQLSYYFPDKTMWQSFVCAMTAAFTLKAFNPFRTGKTVQYQVTFHTGWHGFEILPYIIIGILGGLYGGLFIKLNMRLAKLRQSPRYPLFNKPVLEVAIVAAATALVTFPITFLRAQHTELDYYLFAECVDITSDPLGLCKSGIANTGVIFLLLVSALIAFVFASMTFGLQIPAGILLPSMTVGALYGRVVGLVVEVWQREHDSWFMFSSCEPDTPCVTPGTYAIIGAASALAGTTRMTVSIVVIMFELTGALTYVLPIMIAVMIAKWVGDAISKRGIYESWIQFHEYPFLDHKDGDGDGGVPDVPVSQIMTRFEDLIAFTTNASAADEGHYTISGLKELLRENKYRGFPIVSSFAEPTLLGFISRIELSHALESATSISGYEESTPCFFGPRPQSFMDPDSAELPRKSLDLRPYMDRTPITLNAQSGFQLVINMFERLGLRHLLFVERGQCKGLLTKRDVWFILHEDEIDRNATSAAAGSYAAAGRGQGRETGVLRENGNGENRGLLEREAESGIGLGIVDGSDDEEADDRFEIGDDGGGGAMETGVLYGRNGLSRSGGVDDDDHEGRRISGI